MASFQATGRATTFANNTKDEDKSMKETLQNIAKVTKAQQPPQPLPPPHDDDYRFVSRHTTTSSKIRLAVGALELITRTTQFACSQPALCRRLAE